MIKNHFTHMILLKIRRFLRPMFYNGSSGQVMEAQKMDKDCPDVLRPVKFEGSRE